MRSSLPSGKSAAPPARCIHRPQRDTSSAGYRLLVSRASCGASRELSSRRSPALIPHTCAVSPTFRYGAFLFVASALADLSSARLTSCVHNRASIRHLPNTKQTLIDSNCLTLINPIATNWESATLAPAYAARPTASVDMVSRRHAKRHQHANRPFTTVPRGLSPIFSPILPAPADTPALQPSKAT